MSKLTLIKDILFVSLLLRLLIIANYVTKSESNSCISWELLEKAYNEKSKELKDIPQNDTNEVPHTADELQVDKEQIKRLPTYNKNALVINMTFFVDDINSISDVDMDFIVDFYYMQEWTVVESDCKGYKNSLKGRNISLENKNLDNKLPISKDHFNLFWLPDIMIANAKDIHQQSQVIDTTLLLIYFENATKEYKEICKMEYLARFAARVSCPMDFHDAPIDTQICSIQLRSFAFNKEKIVLSWAKTTIETNPEIKLLEHEYKIGTEKTTTKLFNETYSLLKVVIQFDRKLANKMVGVYTPSILIVVITFCTFWLGLNSTSERVTIGITALLALVTQFNDVRHSLPPTSYITETDKWMIMCMVFVSAQMVQCTLVDFVYHHQQHNQKLKERAMNVLKHFRKNSDNKRRQRLSNVRQQEDHYLQKMNPYAKMMTIASDPKIRVLRNAFTEDVGEPVTEKESNLCFSWFWKAFEYLTSVPTTADKPEYLPMKIDAVSRIMFPLFLLAICSFYWPTMLLKLF